MACMRGRLQAVPGNCTALSSLSKFRHPTTASPSRRAFQASTVVARRNRNQYQKPEADSANEPLTRLETRRHGSLTSGEALTPSRRGIKESKLDFVVRKHLQYLQDPLKLAEHVRESLQNGDINTTLAVVRGASKSMRCTVSWNHLIQWYLDQGMMRVALKTYNEMKKRAQIPDARTFTIIFNGAAGLPSAAPNLGKVISIYHSMLSERSPVRPNTIHVNALLKMCARARNIEAMFAIVDDLPLKGLRAPNNLTYTTIVNAIRREVEVNMRDIQLTPDQKSANKQQAMLDSRRIWQDISKRWRQGDFWIDEELVCAVGRMLLLGEEHDNDDVMSLVEQAMNIPRQAPMIPIVSWKKLPSPTTQDVSEIEGSTSEQGEADTINIEQGRTADAVENHTTASLRGEVGSHGSDLDATFLDQFQPTLPSVSPQTPRGAYAKPGSNTLSLLLQSTEYLRLHEAATNYWDLFTKEYGVLPDADNYHWYLRVLRAVRASDKTVELLRAMPRSYIMSKTYVIAMSTCARDKWNPNVFANACKILDQMQDTLEVLDPTVLISYLQAAMDAYISEELASTDRGAARLAKGRQIIQALDRLEPILFDTDTLLTRGDSSGSNDKAKEEHFDKVITLIRRMISAHDLLAQKRLVPQSWARNQNGERSKLDRLLQKYTEMKSALTHTNMKRKEEQQVRYHMKHKRLSKRH